MYVVETIRDHALTTAQIQQYKVPPAENKIKKVGPMIDSFVNDYFAEFLEGVKNFHWCSLSYLCKSWHKHTKYRFILDLVSKGLSLDLKELLFENINSFHPLSGKKTEIVSNEIIKLLQNKVIVCSIPQNNEFLSHIFTRNKKDTKKKTIFILNKFNKFINWKHIKKDSVHI